MASVSDAGSDDIDDDMSSMSSATVVSTNLVVGEGVSM